MHERNCDGRKKRRGRPAVSQARDGHPSCGRHSGGRSAYPDHRRHSFMRSATRCAWPTATLPLETWPCQSRTAGRRASTRLWSEIAGGHPRRMQWTDDLTVHLARGTSVHTLVRYLRAAEKEGTRRRDVLAVLTERFALPFDDARLAMDRVRGGVVRAASGNPANQPDPVTDPLAWTSYRLALGLKVDDGDPGPSPEERAAAQALLEGARRGEPTRGTEDVAVALEVALRGSPRSIRGRRSRRRGHRGLGVSAGGHRPPHRGARPFR